jgi:hypothetical protein
MSIFRSDILGNWTRGGQNTVHNVRMTTQVFLQTMGAGLVLWVMGTGWYALEKSTEYQRFVIAKVAEAAFKEQAAPGTHDPVLFRTPAGRQYWTSADAVLAAKIGKDALHKLETDLIRGAAIAGAGAAAAVAGAWY